MFLFIVAIIVGYYLYTLSNSYYKKPKFVSFIALDFQTANKNPTSICQVGITIVKKNAIIESKSWYVKPPTKTFTHSHIHHITYEQIKNEKTFSEIWPEIKHLFNDSFVAAHYAHFDITCLVKTLEYYRISCPRFKVYDSCIMSRDTFSFLENAKLNTVADYLNVDFKHHDALGHSLACANIVISIAFTNPDKLSTYCIDDIISKKNYNKYFFNR